MDQLDREVIESLSEPAKRVFGSLDYRSRQRMLKKAKAMAKEEKTRKQKKSRVKKKGIEKQNKAKRKKKGSSSKSEHIIIPDDDETFNFVPGMVYTLLFQELYRHEPESYRCKTEPFHENNGIQFGVYAFA